jgi:hypothetical protein
MVKITEIVIIYDSGEMGEDSELQVTNSAQSIVNFT